MFLFILVLASQSLLHCRFKYISCSYLSLLKYLYAEEDVNLNTSHVLIYLQMQRKKQDETQKFKYISCSYLSMLRKSMLAKTLSFKYISCSYLSLTSCIFSLSPCPI